MSSYTLRASRRSPALHKLMMSSEPEALLASPPCSRKPLPHTCAASIHYHMSCYTTFSTQMPKQFGAKISCAGSCLVATSNSLQDAMVAAMAMQRLGTTKFLHSIQRCQSQEDLSISTAQHSTAQHSTAQHSTAQHSTAWHSTVQHGMAQHRTAQHIKN